VHDVREREIRDLPWSIYRATIVVEVHRLRCPDCGVRVEKIEPLPSKAPFSERFEKIVGQGLGRMISPGQIKQFRAISGVPQMER
jgi:hypothetical protein